MAPAFIGGDCSKSAVAGDDERPPLGTAVAQIMRW
jgi:hypothetical protein